MDLAAHLGGMTVDEMLQRMSNEELDGWAAYNRRHGLTRHRLELHLAQLAYMQSDGKRSVEDFLLKPAADVADGAIETRAETEADATAVDFSVIGGGNVHYITMPKGAQRTWQQV